MGLEDWVQGGHREAALLAVEVVHFWVWELGHHRWVAQDLETQVRLGASEGEAFPEGVGFPDR